MTLGFSQGGRCYGITCLLTLIGALSCHGQSNALVEVFTPLETPRLMRGLGWNVNVSHEWEYERVKAARGSEVRIQFTWEAVENMEGRLALTSTYSNSLAWCAKYGLEPLVIACYGGPRATLCTLTVTNTVASGSYILPVTGALDTVTVPYCHVYRSDGTQIVPEGKWAYYGALIHTVDVSRGTIQLAAKTSMDLTNGTKLAVNRLLYPSCATDQVSDPSLRAYQRYAHFLASQIAAIGLTGRVELWNEPAWAHDGWDSRAMFYDAWPEGITAGSPNWGMLRNALQDKLPWPNVRYSWGGTHKYPRSIVQLSSPAATREQVENCVPTQGFHPYGDGPEDHLWYPESMEQGVTRHLEGANPSSAQAWTQSGLFMNLSDKGWAPVYQFSELGIGTDNQAAKARFIVRSYLAYMSAGPEPLLDRLNFFHLTSEPFAMINSTTHEEYPAYQALKGLMDDVAAMSVAPLPCKTNAFPSIVTPFAGYYPLMTIPVYGRASASDARNRILYVCYQRTYPSTNAAGTSEWAALTIAPVPVTARLPAGYAVQRVYDLAARLDIPYTQVGATLTYPVADNPIAVKLVPNEGVADLALSATVSPNPCVLGTPLTLTLTVTNRTLSATANATVASATLPVGASLVSAIATQGSCSTNAAGQIVCQLGTLASNTAARVDMICLPLLPVTVLTNTASVTCEFDPDLSNNSTSVLTAALAPPRLSVTPPILDFGAQATGTTSEAAFQLSNTGDVSLNGTATLAIGDAFTLLSNGAIALAPHASSTLSVRCRYPSEGTLSDLLLFAGDGGPSTNVLTATGLVPPQAAFAADRSAASVPAAVTFTDLSTGTITNRLWDFGDGFTTSTVLTTLTHTYTTAGTNTVTLVVTGPLGTSTNRAENLLALRTPPTFVWTSSSSGNWNTASKWQGNLAPAAGGSNDTAIAFTNTSTVTSGNTLGAPAFALNRLVFLGGSVTLTGAPASFATSTLGDPPTLVNASANSHSITSPLNLSDGILTLSTTGNKTLTCSGPITGNGGLRVQAAANVGAYNALVVTATNTYSGGTVIETGRVQLNAVGAKLGTGGIAVKAGGELWLSAGASISNAVDLAGNYGQGGDGHGALRFDGTGALAGTVTLQTNANINVYSGTGTVSAAISGGGTLTKADSGVLILRGDNTHAGGTILSAGSIWLGADGSGTASAIRSSPVGTGPLTLSGGTLCSDGAVPRTLLNPVSMTVDTTLGSGVNTGKLALAATLTPTASTGRTLTVNSDVEVSGEIAQAGGYYATFSKNGPGTLTLSGGGTFGVLNDNSGTLVVSDGLYTLENYLTVGSGSSGLVTYLQTGGAVNMMTPYRGAYFPSTGATTATVMRATLSGGSLTVAGQGEGVGVGWKGSATFTLCGQGALSASVLRFLSNAGAVGLFVLGDGTLPSSGTNGVLTVGSVSQTGLGSGTFRFNGGILRTIWDTLLFFQGVTLAEVAEAGGTIDNSGFAITVGQSLLHGGTNSVDGGLSFIGPGVTTLAGTNTYTGTTTIRGGTLLLAKGGKIRNSAAIRVNAGATFDVSAVDAYSLASGQVLTGNGTVMGAVTVQSGAGVAPDGEGPSVLCFSTNVTLQGSTHIRLFPAEACPNDRVALSGRLSCGGSVTVENTGSADALTLGRAFQLFTADSFEGTFETFSLPPLPAGLAWNTQDLARNGRLWVDTQPQISIIQAALDCGAVELTQTGTSAFDVVNLGGSTLTGSVSIAQPFSVQSGVPLALPHGVTGRVVIAFAPQSVGAFQATVTLAGNGGVSTLTVSGTGVQSTPPVAAFSAAPTTGAAPLRVSFTDTSIGSVTNRTWSYGDGTQDSVNPAPADHTYTQPGLYTVTLTASGPLGVSTNRVENLITIRPAALVWTNATGGVWSDDRVWQDRLPPVAGGSDDYAVTFRNTGAAACINDTGNPAFRIGRLAFEGGNATLSGTPFVFADSSAGLAPVLANNSTNVQTFAMPVVIDGTTLAVSTVTNKGLVLNAPITGSGGLLLQGAASGIGQSVDTLTLNSPASYLGGTVIQAGRLKLASGATSLGTGPITVTPDGELYVNAGAVLTNDVFISGDFRGYDILSSMGAIRTDKNCTLSGTLTLQASSTLSVLAGTCTVDRAVVGGYSLAHNGQGVLVLSATNNFGTLDLRGALGGTAILAPGSASTIGTVQLGAYSRAVTMIVQSNSVLDANAIYAGGYGTGYFATLIQNGGRVTVAATVYIGNPPCTAPSLYSIYGGELTLTGHSSYNPFTQGVEHSGTIYVGVNGVGALSLNGGVINAQGLVLDNRSDTTGIDIFALTGGCLTLGRWGIQGNPSTAVLLGGGTLSASEDWSAELPVTLTGSNGLTRVDTAGHTITFSDPADGPGGLLKTGAGELALAALNTYTGATVVSEGTLRCGQLSATTNCVIEAGGTLLLANTASDNSTNRLNDAAAVTLAGGTLSVTRDEGAADTFERLGALRVGAGASAVATAQAAAGRTATLRFASLSRTPGATIDFAGEGLGESDGNRIFIAGLADGPLGRWATVNGLFFAAYSSTRGVYALTSTVTDIAARGPASTVPDDASASVRISQPGVAGPITLAGGTTNRVLYLRQSCDTPAEVATTGKTLLASEIGVGDGCASLTLGESAGDGALAALTPADGLLLQNMNPASSLTVNAAVADGAAQTALSKCGAGDVLLSGPLSYSGGTVVSEGTLAFGGTNQTLTGALSGPGNLAKVGTGTLALSGACTHSGATLVSGGTLRFTALAATTNCVIASGATLLFSNTVGNNNTNRLNDTAAITLAGGTLRFDHDAGAANYAERAGPLMLCQNASTVATVRAAAGRTATLTFASLSRTPGASVDFAGQALGLDDRNRIFIANQPEGPLGPWATVNGTGTASYSFARGVYDPESVYTNIAARGPDSVIPDDVFASARINMPGESGPITLAGERTNSVLLVLQNADTPAVVSTVSNGVSKTLLAPDVQIAEDRASLTIGEKPGDGTLAALAPGGNVRLENKNPASLLTVNANVADNASASSLSKFGPGKVLLAGSNSYAGATLIGEGTLAFGGGATQTLAGVISGAGVLSKEGAGRLTLSGANTFTNTTVVSGGTLLVQNSAALGTAAAGTEVSNGATLDLGGTLGANALNLGAESVTVSGAGVNGRGAIVNSSGTSQFNALRFLTLAGDTTFGGEQSNGRWDVRNTASPATLTLNGFNLTKVGSNYVGLTGVNVLPGAGSIDVKEGWFTLEAGTAMNGGATNVLTVRGGAVFDIYNLSTPVSWRLVMDDNARFYARSGNVTNQNIWAGPVTLNGRVVFDAAGTYSDTVSGNISGTGSVVKTTANSTTYFTGTNTYSGTTTVSNGTLYANGSFSLPGYNASGKVTVTAGATLEVRAGDGVSGWSGAQFGSLQASAAFAANTAVLGVDTAVTNLTVDSNIRQALSLTKFGNNTLTLAGTNTYSGTTRVTAGTLVFGGASSNTLGAISVNGGSAGAALVLNGPTLLPSANTLTAGSASGDRAAVYITTNVYAYNYNLGTVSGAAGAVYHSGGTNACGAYLGIGSGASGQTTPYGYYRLTGGTLTVGTYFEIGTYGHAVMDVFGGMVAPGGNSTFDINRRSGYIGVLNVFGGTVRAPSGSNPLQMGRGDFYGPNARLNVFGAGVVDASIGSTSKMLDLNACTNAAVAGIVNLNNGGTLIANKVSATRAGLTLLNFNGGTLSAAPGTSVGTAFLQGLAAAVVYSGGAAIDTSNAYITVSQSLVAPTGYGVSAIPLRSAGAGYIGAPAVSITGGSGTGATAIATVDLSDGSPTVGQVTGLTITSPGFGYLPSDSVNVTLLGGGYTAQAVTNSCVFAANSASGGLTKLGSGTLTLMGTNTYGGTTAVSNGVLRFGVRETLPAGTDIAVGDGIIDLGGFSLTNRSIRVNGGSLINGSLASDSLTKAGTGTFTLAAPLTSLSPLSIVSGVLSLRSSQPGLYEGAVGGSFSTTSNNPCTSVRLGTFMGNTTSSWPSATTYIYSGYLWNRLQTNVTWTFAENFDDSVLLKIDGNTVLNNGTWNTPTLASLTLTPGAHALAAYFGQASGGAGPVNSSWWKTTAFGFGVDVQGRGDTNILNYTALTDPGTGSLLTLTTAGGGQTNLLVASSSVEVAAGAAFDLGGTTQTLASLSGSGIVSNGTLAVTGTLAPGGTNSIGTLTLAASAALTGTLLTDVALNGACDRLNVTGSLDLSALALEIANPDRLSSRQCYTVLTVLGTRTGTFRSLTVPNSRWHVLYLTDGTVKLVCTDGVLLKLL